MDRTPTSRGHEEEATINGREDVLFAFADGYSTVGMERAAQGQG
jgi:hypothetical protein